MESTNLSELHETIRAILRKKSRDPLSQCLAYQLEIVLETLEGWDSLMGLITGAEA